jgi:transcriptional regulator GlxA family with amidase domain
MASGVAMSDRQLLRKLRALLDTRPADYLRDYRLQRAAEMLETDKPVGIVAQDCGFATQAHFGQCFKARFGVTPGEYAQTTAADGSRNFD